MKTARSPARAALEARPPTHRASMGRPFRGARLEDAATPAIEIGALTYGSVRSILEHKLDRYATHKSAETVSIIHPNIRGSRYYYQ
jgi:hypothetical protein